MKIALYLFPVLLITDVVPGQGVPAIVESSPKFWQTNVAPTLKQVSITFDREMRYGFSSWLGVSSILPTSELQSTYAPDARTFNLNVSVEPAKVYVFALNEKQVSGVGFQTKRGVPLAPHFLVFQTAGTPKPEDAPPVVVRSSPTNSEQQVDPARTKAIVLTFDRPMQAGKQGLHLFENNNVIDLSKTRFAYSPDGRTFTLYYDFKASTQYRVALNNVNDVGFASVSRIPLWPVQITFATGQPH